MQNLIFAGEISLIQELWNYIVENLFSNEIPYLENFKLDANALFSIRGVIVGITVGIILAAISTVYNKRYVGEFVRSLLYEGCTDAKSAKTLSELEYIGYSGIRSALKSGGSLTRWVRCVEEDEFYSELERQRAEFEEAHKDESKPPKFKEPEFRRDVTSMHFYVPEEMKYKAEVKFDKTGTDWWIVLVVSAIAIAICAFLCYIVPDVLKYMDSFVSILNAI